MEISISDIIVAGNLEGLINLLKTTKNTGLNIKCHVKNMYDTKK